MADTSDNSELLENLMNKIEEFYFDDGEDSGEACFNRFAEKYADLFDDNFNAKDSENKLEYILI